MKKNKLDQEIEKVQKRLDAKVVDMLQYTQDKMLLRLLKTLEHLEKINADMGHVSENAENTSKRPAED